MATKGLTAGVDGPMERGVDDLARELFAVESLDLSEALSEVGDALSFLSCIAA
jgi:hypothetical protein